MQELIIKWVINWAIAYITRWLDQNQPTAKINRVAKPTPILRPKLGAPRKYTPVSTVPGTWNRQEGRWNT